MKSPMKYHWPYKAMNFYFKTAAVLCYSSSNFIIKWGCEMLSIVLGSICFFYRSEKGDWEKQLT